MNKFSKLFLGILSLWPFLYVVGLFVYFILYSIFITSVADEQSALITSAYISGTLVLNCVTAIEVVILLVIYIIDIFHTTDIEQDKKLYWIIMVLIGNVFVLPVYWFFYILQKKSKP